MLQQISDRLLQVASGSSQIAQAVQEQSQVTADIDHSRSTTQEQRYDPDGQVVRSTQTSQQNANETRPGATGAVVINGIIDVSGSVGGAMGCVGTGDACEFFSNECDGDVMVTCAGGKLGHRDCGALTPEGQSCGYVTDGPFGGGTPLRLGGLVAACRAQVAARRRLGAHAAQHERRPAPAGRASGRRCGRFDNRSV